MAAALYGIGVALLCVGALAGLVGLGIVVVMVIGAARAGRLLR